MIGHRRGGSEPHIQPLYTHEPYGWCSFGFLYLATGLVGYIVYMTMIYHLEGRTIKNDDLFYSLGIVVVWIGLLVGHLRGWWQKWYRAPGAEIDLRTGEVTFTSPLANQTTFKAADLRVKEVELVRTRRSPQDWSPDGPMIPGDDGMLDTTWMITQANQRYRTPPFTRIYMFEGGLRLQDPGPMLRRVVLMVESLVSGFDSGERWWKTGNSALDERPFPEFKYDRRDLLDACTTRDLAYQEAVFGIARYRAHKHRRTRLTRHDFDQAAKRLLGEPITGFNYFERLLELLLSPLRWPATAPLIAATGTIASALFLFNALTLLPTGGLLLPSGIAAGTGVIAAPILWWLAGRFWVGSAFGIGASATIIWSAIETYECKKAAAFLCREDMLFGQGFIPAAGESLAFGVGALILFSIVTFLKFLERYR